MEEEDVSIPLNDLIGEILARQLAFDAQWRVLYTFTTQAIAGVTEQDPVKVEEEIKKLINTEILQAKLKFLLKYKAYQNEIEDALKDLLD